MRLPPGWKRTEPRWYTNAELRCSVAYETAGSTPTSGGAGYYVWPWWVGAPSWDYQMPNGPYRTAAAAFASLREKEAPDAR